MAEILREISSAPPTITLSVMEPKAPKLMFLDAERFLNRVKLDFFRRLQTEELRASLAPGEPGSLKVRTNGTVLDGHHRLRILLERGEDVDGLPREIMEKSHEP